MKLELETGVKAAGFRSGLAGMRNDAKRFQGQIKNILGGIGISIGFNNLTQLLRDMDRVGKLALQFGLSAELVQKLDFVAGLAGQSFEMVAKAMRATIINSQEAAKGVATYDHALAALNQNSQEFASLDPEEQFLRIADAVAYATDRNVAYAAASRLMGARQAELIPLLQQGREAIEAQMNSIDVRSQKTINRAQAVNDLFLRIGTSIKIFFGEGIMSGVQLIQVAVIKAMDALKPLMRMLEVMGLAHAEDSNANIERVQKKVAAFGNTAQPEPNPNLAQGFAGSGTADSQNSGDSAADFLKKSEIGLFDKLKELGREAIIRSGEIAREQAEAKAEAEQKAREAEQKAREDKERKLAGLRRDQERANFSQAGITASALQAVGGGGGVGAIRDTASAERRRMISLLEQQLQEARKKTTQGPAIAVLAE